MPERNEKAKDLLNPSDEELATLSPEELLEVRKAKEQGGEGAIPAGWHAASH